MGFLRGQLVWAVASILIMNTLAVLSVVLAFSTCHGFLADVLNSLGNIDPFLIEFCQPLDAPANGKVSCEYRPTELMCQATCNAGYSMAAGTSMTKTCRTDANLWGAEAAMFPACTSNGQTGQTGTVPVVKPGNCVSSLSECIARGNGDYPSCTGCHQFVSCANDGIHIQDCPNNLRFDDTMKRCVYASSTC